MTRVAEPLSHTGYSLTPAKDRIVLTVTSGNRSERIRVYPRATLAQNLFAAGYYHSRPLCAGVGTCGRCRIRYIADPPSPGSEEKDIFSSRQLEAGWRLACKQYPVPDRVIAVPASMRPEAVNGPGMEHAAPFTDLAVDIGTTAIKWQGIQQGKAEPLSGTLINPQVGAGADVMSRMAFALADSDFPGVLHRCLVDAVRSLIRRADPVHPPRLVLTGNSVMMYSLLDLSLGGLATSPYALDYFGDEHRTIPAHGPADPLSAYIPPLLAPFVGADVSCGLCHLLLHHVSREMFPFILADFGTNGEFVLGLAPERYLVTSVAMGPALEGVGLTRGKMAGPQVCTGFEIGPTGLRPVAGRVEKGVSGTGYLSLVSVLKRLGAVDVTGGFRPPTHPLGRVLKGMFQKGPRGTVLTWNHRSLLTGRDVEEILKLKASCNQALKTLLEEGGLTQGAIRNVFLAGSLGVHLRPLDLVDLGFVPRIWEKKIRLVGNTSLGGAWDLLTRNEAKEVIRGVGRHVRSVDLPGQRDFTGDYVSRMRFMYC
jgi:uncharacterized 2Fe-2S/4Fe-4S cluster protein (DUF4445 family)